MATLHIQRQQEIEAKVDSLKLTTGFSYPEQSLNQFAQLLSVKALEADLSPMGSNVSGVIQWVNKDGKQDPLIIVNSKYPPQRKIFTLAHELGHFVLHKGEDKLRVDEFDYSQNTDEVLQESEANFFAACLLVPRAKLDSVLAVANGNLGAVADYFGVSIPMIEARLRWLKTNSVAA